jgi:hypothetical protein
VRSNRSVTRSAGYGLEKLCTYGECRQDDRRRGREADIDNPATCVGLQNVADVPIYNPESSEDGAQGFTSRRSGCANPPPSSQATFWADYILVPNVTARSTSAAASSLTDGNTGPPSDSIASCRDSTGPGAQGEPTSQDEWPPMGRPSGCHRFRSGTTERTTQFCHASDSSHGQRTTAFVPGLATKDSVYYAAVRRSRGADDGTSASTISALNNSRDNYTQQQQLSRSR